jgi:hypothetical protein
VGACQAMRPRTTLRIDQENEPGDDRSRGENDGKLGCCRAKLKEVVGDHFAVALGFGLLGSFSEFLTALAWERTTKASDDGTTETGTRTSWVRRASPRSRVQNTEVGPVFGFFLSRRLSAEELSPYAFR